jgi:uncharacterized membrane protein YjfL (UPF0719 family)
MWLKKLAAVLGTALIITTAAIAQTTTTESKLLLSLEEGLLGFVVYSILGMSLLIIAYKIVDVFLPGKSGQELVENKNVALAIVIAAFLIGISIIIAAAIVG